MSKILHVVEAFGGGVVTFLNSLAHSQLEQGDEVAIAYGIRQETPEDFKLLFDERVQWIEIKGFQRKPGLNDLHAIVELISAYRACKPDVIHAHSAKAGMLCRALKMLGIGKKVFYTPHGFPFLMSNISKNKRRFYYYLEKAAAKFTRSITIACSENEYKVARSLSKNCTFVNNGVSPLELEQYMETEHVVDTKHPRVCTVARVITQKNPKAFNRIAEQLPDIEFKWIGGGLLEPLLKAENIDTTGWQERNDAIELLSEMDIFLLPSKWEGLSISLLEAMYLKKLCIASDIDGNRLAIQHGVNGFIFKTEEEACQIIRGVQDGSIDYHAIVENAHNYVLENHNADRMTEEYTKIYNRM